MYIHTLTYERRYTILLLKPQPAGLYLSTLVDRFFGAKSNRSIFHDRSESDAGGTGRLRRRDGSTVAECLGAGRQPVSHASRYHRGFGKEGRDSSRGSGQALAPEARHLALFSGPL